MATIHRPAGVTLRDVRGFTAHVYWYQAYDSAAEAGAISAAATLASNIVALSNAVVNSTTGLASAGVVPLAYGVGATYYSVADKARTIWRTASGGVLIQRIPAPLRALFLPDGTTINPANVAVALYRAAFLAAGVSTPGGDLAVTFVAGKLYTRPARRRISTTVLDPTLTTSSY